MRSPAFPSLPLDSSDYFQPLLNGALVSEVGDAVPVPYWNGKCQGFELRKSRIRPRRLLQQCGGMVIGEAMCPPVWETFELPAVGTSKVFQPKIHGMLSRLLKWCQQSHADMTAIVYIPAPLGFSMLLRVDAPELDSTTTTRGVKWKPSQIPCIPFFLGWNVDVPAVYKDGARLGNNGLAIRIETIEDACSEGMQDPRQGFICWYPSNVEISEWVSPTAANFAGVLPPDSWLFAELPAPEPSNNVTEFSYLPSTQSDESESTPALSGETPDPGPSLAGTEGETPAPAQTEVIKPTPVPKDAMGPASSKGGAALNQKWTKITTLDISKETKARNTITVNPNARTFKGEDLARPFRKYVWVAPSLRGEEYKGMEFKLVSNVSPYIRGFLFARITSSAFPNHGDVYWHELGGASTQFYEWGESLVAATNQRRVTSPWRRVSEYTSVIDVNVGILMTAQTAAKGTLTVYARPGKLRFNVPTKPRKVPSSVLKSVTRSNEMAFLMHCRELLNAHDVVPQLLPATQGLEGTDEERATAKEDPFCGVSNPLSCGEDTFFEDVDHFVTKVADFNIPTNGDVLSLSLDLTKVPDLDGAGGENPVTERFSRFVDHAPTRQGMYGPVMGKYFIKLRPPAHITADLQHVAVPGDMSTEVAIRFFGLDSILSLAGGALSSVGGSLLSGAIDTVGNFIGDTIGGLFGTSSQGQSQPNPTPAPEAAAPALSGDLPFSRFLEFMKSFDGAPDMDLKTIQLLMKFVNFIGTDSNARAIESIPASLYLQLDSVESTRSTYARTVDIPDAVTLRSEIPLDAHGLLDVMEAALVSNTERGDAIYRKCLSFVVKRGLSSETRVLAHELLEEQLVAPAQVSAHRQMVSGRVARRK
jgi:hypothetical protein